MAQALDDIPLQTLDGAPSHLGDHRGKVRLVVNVASKCGLTPQYEGLEKLHRKLREKGFTVLGFPANDFAGQEPGTNAEIAAFCSSAYDVTFPMFAKLKATGHDKHPLYAALTAAQPRPVNSDQNMRDMLSKHGLAPNAPPEVLWNFEKFVVGRDGAVLARFSPDTAPDDAKLIETIEDALSAKEF